MSRAKCLRGIDALYHKGQGHQLQTERSLFFFPIDIESFIRCFPVTGIILTGSPYSVYDEDAPHADPEIYTLGIPILGICYGLQVRYYILLFFCSTHPSLLGNSVEFSW